MQLSIGDVHQYQGGHGEEEKVGIKTRKKKMDTEISLIESIVGEQLQTIGSTQQDK
jgi:hypothetical protein